MINSWTTQQKLNFMAVLLPILVYLGAVVHFAVNIPLGDDFGNILIFFHYNNDAKIALLFAQHNEHRLFFNRVIAWLFYALQGNINFTSLIYFANIALVYIFVLLVKSVPTQRNLLFFLPVALLIFSLRNWENTTWAMAGLQNFYVVVFALCALYAFSEKTTSGFVATLLFASLATYTSGSGILCFVVLFLWFFSDAIFAKRHALRSYSSIHFLVFMLVFLAVTISYFTNYKGPETPAMSFTLMAHYLVLLGGYATSSKWAMFCGSISLLIFAWLTFKQSYLKYPFWYFSVVFILGSLSAVSFHRAEFFGIEQALSSRYVILSLLLSALLYLMLLESLPKHLNRYLLGIAISLCVAMNILTIEDSYENLQQRKVSAIRDITAWFNNQINDEMPDGFFLHCKPAISCRYIIKRSIENGIYRLP